MKKLILFLIIILTTNLSAFAVTEEINSQKQRSLSWYKNNVSQNQYNLAKEAEALKNKAITWYQNNVVKKPPYNKYPEKEVSLKKEKALKWHLRNSH